MTALIRRVIFAEKVALSVAVVSDLVTTGSAPWGGGGSLDAVIPALLVGFVSGVMTRAALDQISAQRRA